MISVIAASAAARPGPVWPPEPAEPACRTRASRGPASTTGTDPATAPRPGATTPGRSTPAAGATGSRRRAHGGSAGDPRFRRSRAGTGRSPRRPGSSQRRQPGLGRATWRSTRAQACAHLASFSLFPLGLVERTQEEEPNRLGPADPAPAGVVVHAPPQGRAEAHVNRLADPGPAAVPLARHRP